MPESVFLAVALIGLIHGLEPGHGWPLAMMYAVKSSRPVLMGFLSSWIISAFHLISSVAVVAFYVILKFYLDLSLPYMNYIAGGGLLILAVKAFLEKPKDGIADQHGHTHPDFVGEHEHEHEHPGGIRHTHRHRHAKKMYLTLSSLAAVAFLLGFAHEEEFALLSLAVGGVDPLSLMLAYASAVTVGLVGVTLLALSFYRRLEDRLTSHIHLIPKLSGAILLVMAATFLLNLR